tara:strand:+ start:2411 stop:3529 length:1119 start_codon:yes stop_codon:yes gene_type:complete
MSELDTTIEELEAEVLAELEEANGADAPMKSAAPADKPEKVKDEVNKEEDLGGAKPEAKVEKGADEDRPEKSIGKKAAASADEVGGDAQQKGEGKPDAPQKLAAGDEVEMTDEQEVVSEDKETDDNIEERISDINVKEDVSALISGEDLSEEFKVKAATIFEAAVKSKIRSEVVRMEEEYSVQLAEATETIKEELSEKVDSYLGYVVEEWMKENEIAVERGLKGEIAEDFISGLKQLFEDHYIDVPDEKYDILEAQSEKISELEEKLNASIEENVERRKVVESLTRDAVIHEVSEELTVTEMEKFKSLTEELEFVSEDSFRQKLDTLKESYFPKTSGEESFVIVDGDSEEPAQDIDTTDTIKTYLSAISRTK